MKFDQVAICQHPKISRWLTPDGAANLRFKLGMFESDPAFADIRWIAYALATCLRETGPNLKPIREYPTKADPMFKRYEQPPFDKWLGNTKPGDGMLFCGRGDVQLTGRANYEKMGKLIGAPLVSQPDLALVPENAYRIMSIGMVRGIFTGKKLADYINAKGCDYLNARRIINGVDHAQEIADNAKIFEAALTAAVLS